MKMKEQIKQAIVEHFSERDQKVKKNVRQLYQRQDKRALSEALADSLECEYDSVVAAARAAIAELQGDTVGNSTTLDPKKAN